MIIYGVALIAISLLVGTLVGDLLGIALGVDGNVGGVGIGMVVLLLLVGALKKRGQLTEPTQNGLAFWGAMYIPIVVAMAASQNVVGAVSRGPLAIIAGVTAVLASFMLVPLFSKFGRQDSKTFDDGQGGNSA